MGLPSAIDQATILPSSGTTNDTPLIGDLDLVAGRPGDGQAGAGGTGGRGVRRPTSTIFADAGAAVARTATSAVTTMKGRWDIARMKHGRGPGGCATPRVRGFRL